MEKLSNDNKTRVNKCFLCTVHDRTPRLYRKCVYLILEKVETNLNYDYLTKIGNSSGLPELICFVISAVPRRIFIPLNRYGRQKNEPKCLKTSPIFLTLIGLITVHSSYLIILCYLITLFSCLASKSS